MSSAVTQDVVSAAGILNPPVKPKLETDELAESPSPDSPGHEQEDETILKEEEDYLFQCDDSSADGEEISPGPIDTSIDKQAKAANEMNGQKKTMTKSVKITEITTNGPYPNQVSGDDDDDDQQHAEQSNKIMLAAQAPGGRRRLFSIDIDPAASSELDTNNILDTLNPAQLLGEAGIIDMMLPPLSGDAGTNNAIKKTSQRDRGFSFEFFSFQADELDDEVNVTELMLGGTTTMSSGIQQRPRGESIIFDPTSFDEGGIHEERALQLRQQDAATSSSLTTLSNTDILQAQAHGGNDNNALVVPLTVVSNINANTNTHHHNHARPVIPTIPKMLDSSLPLSLSSDRINMKQQQQPARNINSNQCSVQHHHPGAKYATNKNKNTNSSSSSNTITRAHNPLHKTNINKNKNINSSTNKRPRPTSSAAAPLNHRTYTSSSSTNTTKSSTSGTRQIITNNIQHLHHQPMNTNTSNNMNLMNKGGRIGIYLPEARRARIAKFHSKRKNRIWRKRIKYDCRKKLADSRPRVKGRFVKRANVVSVDHNKVTVVKVEKGG